MNTRAVLKLFLILSILSSFLSVPWAHASAAPTATIIFVNVIVNDGLVAHWKFDENGAVTALDFLKANPAALQDTASMSNASLPTLTVPDPGSLALDGINDYAQINAPTSALSLTTSFTVAAWVRRATTGTYDAIYDSGTQANKWWIFIADGSAGKVNHLGFGERGVAEVYSTASIVDTNWHHVVVEKNGDGANNILFFVDGVASGQGSAGTVTAPSGSARIGALLEGSVSAQFGGNIDDLRLYNRALTAAEVARLAQGKSCVTDGATWGTSFRELQCGLSAAAAGQEIWLAGGSYHPGTARGVSFNLVNGVSLLGGFLGNESLASQRPAFNPNAPMTTLSGDILGDDAAGFTNRTDNSLQVVVEGAGVGSTLDGLAIRDGNNTASASTGAGLQVQPGALGLTLTNVVIGGSSADGNGAGLFNQAPLTLNNVTLTGNRSLNGFGGGLFSLSAITANNLQVLNNSAIGGAGIESSAPVSINGGLFDSNQALHFFGGGIDTQANLSLTNVNFNKNQAQFAGGAVESSGQILTISGGIFSANFVQVFTGGAIDTSAFTTTTIQNSAFNGNSAVESGGAINNSNGMTIAGTSFDLNQVIGGNCIPVCSSGQGGAIASSGTLVATVVTFTNNSARLDGGAIASTGPSTQIKTATFTGNKAGSPADAGNPGLGNGGAIYSTGPLDVNQVNILSNSAQANGGGVYAAGNMILANTTLQLNTGLSGGGLYTNIGGTLSNSNILTNTASSLGGGVDLASGSLIITGSAFQGNQALGVTGQGGGLNNVGGTVNITGGAFRSNSGAKGGGLFSAGVLTTNGVLFFKNASGGAGTGGGIDNVGVMTDQGSTFDQNTAGIGGGVAFAAGDTTSGHGSFTGTQFLGNTATSGGGLNSINDVTLTDATFTNNQASGGAGDGGGMFTSGGTATLTGVTFSGNTGGRFGGGGRLAGAILQGSRFFNNSVSAATSEGGALLLTQSSQVTGCIFANNTSGLSGGISMQGISATDRSMTLQVINSLFYDNQANSAAGADDMRLFDLTITLANNTFGRARAANQLSVEYLRSNLNARNNIWNSYANSLRLGQSAIGTTISVDYNLYFNAPLDNTVTSGAHDLTGDPHFANPSTNDFRLLSNSPAIDSGDRTILPAGLQSDLATLPRFINDPAVPDTGVGAPAVDRGALEFAVGRLYLPFVFK